ncbi:MAG TPA: hypothetical protein VGV87_19475 [Blastocatellia bacterium]|jgi:hypothetical protein|nr:hypothetical protein [Blastocatellia bacterium]
MGKDRSKKLKLVIVGLAAALLVGALACRNSKQADNTNRASTPPPAAAPAAPQPQITPVDAAVIERVSPFNHNRAEHKKLDCSVCHERTDNEPAPRFPGHSACNDCHQKDFSAANSQLCAGCHKMPLAAQPELISFPARLRQLGLKSFSHRQHLNPDASKWPAGSEKLKCEACHGSATRLETSFPKHPQCYSCHTHQAGEKLGECGVCHSDRTIALKYNPGPGPASTLYNFKHDPHTKRASCDRCHALTATSAKVAPDILQINTARGQRHNSTCFTCHNRTKETLCTKCHLGSVPF